MATILSRGRWVKETPSSSIHMQSTTGCRFRLLMLAVPCSCTCLGHISASQWAPWWPTTGMWRNRTIRRSQCTILISSPWLVRGNTSQWHHNVRDGVSTQWRQECLHNRSFRRKSKKTSKLRATGLCEAPHKGPVTRKIFPSCDVIIISISSSVPWGVSLFCVCTMMQQRTMKFRVVQCELRSYVLGVFVWAQEEMPSQRKEMFLLKDLKNKNKTWTFESTIQFPFMHIVQAYLYFVMGCSILPKFVKVYLDSGTIIRLPKCE